MRNAISQASRTDGCSRQSDVLHTGAVTLEELVVDLPVAVEGALGAIEYGGAVRVRGGLRAGVRAAFSGWCLHAAME